MATSSFALHLTFIVGMEAADPRCSIESSHTLTLCALSNNGTFRSYYKSLQIVYEHRMFSKRTIDSGAVSSKV